MTDITRIQPDDVASPYAHYSSVTQVGDRLYVAGLVPIDTEGELVAGGDARAQTVHVCRTLETIARQFGAGLDRVVQCTLYITRREDYRDIDAGYAQVFGNRKPSRATVIVGLTDPEFLVELVAWLEL
jgi:enamine deaminase RidA (YjgF/YER057c/UK114 family)